jgi:hypothetical protein
MIDEADERWIAEHGYADDNPLLGQIEHARDLLRDTPELGIEVRKLRFRRSPSADSAPGHARRRYRLVPSVRRWHN